LSISRIVLFLITDLSLNKDCDNRILLVTDHINKLSELLIIWEWNFIKIIRSWIESVDQVNIYFNTKALCLDNSKKFLLPFTRVPPNPSNWEISNSKLLSGIYPFVKFKPRNRRIKDRRIWRRSGPESATPALFPTTAIPKLDSYIVLTV